MKRGLFYSMLFGVIAICFACQPTQEPNLDFELNPNIERAEEIEILYSDSGQVKVSIQGPVMLSHISKTNPQQEFPEGVWVEFFDDDGKVSSELTGNHAWLFEREDRVMVKDSVVWKSKNQEMLETEELIWDERTQKVFTKQFAKITRPEEIIYGYGFEADQDFKNARINAVTGRIKIEEPSDQ